MTDFSYCFYQSSITHLPSLTVNVEVNANFYRWFDTARLTTIAADAIKCSGTANFNMAFYVCQYLTDVPITFFDECAGFSSLSSCFYACYKLKSGVIPITNGASVSSMYNNSMTLLESVFVKEIGRAHV